MSQDRFTADDARELMRVHTPEYHVEKIIDQVRQAAQKGSDTLKTYACNFGDGALYSGQPSELQKAVMAQLRDLGFEVRIRVEERQFVDVWLEVSWKPAQPKAAP